MFYFTVHDTMVHSGPLQFLRYNHWSKLTFWGDLGGKRVVLGEVFWQKWNPRPQKPTCK